MFPGKQVGALAYLLENALAVFHIFFRHAAAAVLRGRRGGDSARDDGTMGNDHEAGREVSVFMGGAAQAQGRKVLRPN